MNVGLCMIHEKFMAAFGNLPKKTPMAYRLFLFPVIRSTINLYMILNKGYWCLN